MYRFVVMAAFGAFSANVLAASFTFKFENYPKSEAGCHAAAIEVGARFREGSGMEQVVSRCLAENKSGYQIEVTYEAEERVKTVTTSPRLGVEDSLGRYPSQAACEQALAQERELFLQDTNHTPSFAFCAEERPADQDKWGWHLYLLAFGESERSFFVSSYAIFGVPIDLTGTQYRAALFAELQKRGMTPLSLVFRSQLAYAYVNVTYYGSKRERFEMTEVTKNRTVEQCQSQMEPARQILADSKNPPMMIYCAKASVGSTPELNILYYGPSPYRVRPSAERYKDFAECEAKRPALLDYYVTELKLPVKGGLCSKQIEDNNRYAVMLFEGV